jgi:hypothetical protein
MLVPTPRLGQEQWRGPSSLSKTISREIVRIVISKHRDCMPKAAGDVTEDVAMAAVVSERGKCGSVSTSNIKGGHPMEGLRAVWAVYDDACGAVTTSALHFLSRERIL